MRVEGNVTVEGARIIFRNFRGKPDPFNKDGDRNFGVILPPDIAEQMARDGWTIKTLKPREEDEDGEETPWIKVKVNYDGGRPPKITLVTERGPTLLDQSMVDQLDGVDIVNVDLIFRPYNWNAVDGREGVTAYLQTMFITIEEDPLERKWAEKFANQDPQ